MFPHLSCSTYTCYPTGEYYIQRTIAVRCTAEPVVSIVPLLQRNFRQIHRRRQAIHTFFVYILKAAQVLALSHHHPYLIIILWNIIGKSVQFNICLFTYINIYIIFVSVVNFLYIDIYVLQHTTVYYNHYSEFPALHGTLCYSI